MHEVFISYKSNDSQLGNIDGTVAKEICKELEAAGISCWIAPDCIPDGEDYADIITDAIENCIVQIVVFSKYTLLSQYVPDEVRLARDSMKSIISFKLDDTPFEKKWKFYLGGKQWFDARGDYRKRIPELISVLQRKLGKTNSTDQSSDVTSQSKDKPATDVENPQQPCPPPEGVVIDGAASENTTSSWRRIKRSLEQLLNEPEDTEISEVADDGASSLKAVMRSLLKGADDTETPAEHENPPIETFTVNGVSFNMVRVDGGTFVMGAPNQSRKAQKNEKPAHTVTLSPYYIGETLVTQELWQAVMDTKPSSNHPLPLNPVENVSWKECQTFIEELNEITHRKFRLLTEAEWEFAARANDEKELVLGYMNELYSEWCQDIYGEYQANDQINPIGPAKGDCRVCRGGYRRVSARDYYYPSVSLDNLGFRLAL